MATPSSSPSLFAQPIKQHRDDETTKKVKATLGDFDQVQQMLLNDHKPLIGISNREVARINGSKAKVEQIFSEMRLNTIKGLEEEDDDDDECSRNAIHQRNRESAGSSFSRSRAAPGDQSQPLSVESNISEDNNDISNLNRSSAFFQPLKTTSRCKNSSEQSPSSFMLNASRKDSSSSHHHRRRRKSSAASGSSISNEDDKSSSSSDTSSSDDEDSRVKEDVSDSSRDAVDSANNASGDSLKQEISSWNLISFMDRSAPPVSSSKHGDRQTRSPSKSNDSSLMQEENSNPRVVSPSTTPPSDDQLLSKELMSLTNNNSDHGYIGNDTSNERRGKKNSISQIIEVTRGGHSPELSSEDSSSYEEEGKRSSLIQNRSSDSSSSSQVSSSSRESSKERTDNRPLLGKSSVVFSEGVPQEARQEAKKRKNWTPDSRLGSPSRTSSPPSKHLKSSKEHSLSTSEDVMSKVKNHFAVSLTANKTIRHSKKKSSDSDSDDSSSKSSSQEDSEEDVSKEQVIQRRHGKKRDNKKRKGDTKHTHKINDRSLNDDKVRHSEKRSQEEKSLKNRKKFHLDYVATEPSSRQHISSDSNRLDNWNKTSSLKERKASQKENNYNSDKIAVFSNIPTEILCSISLDRLKETKKPPVSVGAKKAMAVKTEDKTIDMNCVKTEPEVKQEKLDAFSNALFAASQIRSKDSKNRSGQSRTTTDSLNKPSKKESDASKELVFKTEKTSSRSSCPANRPHSSQKKTDSINVTTKTSDKISSNKRPLLPDKTWSNLRSSAFKTGETSAAPSLSSSNAGPPSVGETSSCITPANVPTKNVSSITKNLPTGSNLSSSLITPIFLTAESNNGQETTHQYYLSNAKKLKHAADKESHRVLQLSKYIEAVLYFTLSAHCMEHNQGNRESLAMFRDTLNLLKHTTSCFKRSQQTENEVSDHKLCALSYRCQALLMLKMSRLRGKEIQENHKVIRAAPEVPASSVKEVTIPVNVYSAMRKQLALLSDLNAAHDAWTSADYLIDKYSHCKAFFRTIDLDAGVLSLSSSFDELVSYVRTGLQILH